MTDLLYSLLGGIALIVLVFIALYRFSNMSGKLVAVVMAFLVTGIYVPIAIFLWPGADVFAIHIAMYLVTVYVLGIISAQRDVRKREGHTGFGFHWAPATIVVFFLLIITGYLRARFAQNKPLAVSASLCFEQSYSGVEGDSASSTEVYALLSSLSGLPLRQDIAVTGSLNQKGEIQPIGGVNHKIEGFYQVCLARGLTGDQGVIIPQQNVTDLMLNEEVVEAVSRGKFHIYPVETIEQGIEILTGVKAGRLNADGSYEKDSVFYLADKKLQEFADVWKSYQ